MRIIYKSQENSGAYKAANMVYKHFFLLKFLKACYAYGDMIYFFIYKLLLMNISRKTHTVTYKTTNHCRVLYQQSVGRYLLLKCHLNN